MLCELLLITIKVVVCAIMFLFLCGMQCKCTGKFGSIIKTCRNEFDCIFPSINSSPKYLGRYLIPQITSKYETKLA